MKISGVCVTFGNTAYCPYRSVNCNFRIGSYYVLCAVFAINA